MRTFFTTFIFFGGLLVGNTATWQMYFSAGSFYSVFWMANSAVTTLMTLGLLTMFMPGRLGEVCGCLACPFMAFENFWAVGALLLVTLFAVIGTNIAIWFWVFNSPKLWMSAVFLISGAVCGSLSVLYLIAPWNFAISDLRDDIKLRTMQKAL